MAGSPGTYLSKDRRSASKGGVTKKPNNRHGKESERERKREMLLYVYIQEQMTTKQREEEKEQEEEKEEEDNEPWKTLCNHR